MSPYEQLLMGLSIVCVLIGVFRGRESVGSSSWVLERAVLTWFENSDLCDLQNPCLPHCFPLGSLKTLQLGRNQSLHSIWGLSSSRAEISCVRSVVSALNPLVRASVWRCPI